jgi:glycosyltransferase involved in cell wall biosynthesis
VKIALVTRRYWPAVGGIERVTAELARAFAALGHQPLVVTQRVDEGAEGWLTHTLRDPPRFEQFEHDGLLVRQFRLSPRNKLLLAPLAHEAVPRLPSLTKGRTRVVTAPWYGRVAGQALAPLLEGPDVVHVLGGAWVSVAGVEAARRLAVPVVVTPFVHRGFWRDDPASLRSYRHADVVLATTEADARDLRALGVPAKKIRVAGLPVPKVAEATGVPEEPPIVLFAGARVQHKGIELLRASARGVWETWPDTRFAYIGPGEALRELDPRELDVGRVSDSERGDWFSRATLVCLPSSSESFGLVVAEAWSAGKPVVTSDIAVLRELVEGSEGGYAVPRNVPAITAAIAKLLNQPELARDLGRAGFRYWSEQCRPEAVATRHLIVYEDQRRSRHA